ncbi:hypothetical protein LguiB_033170 [Lonicera macranthoides]
MDLKYQNTESLSKRNTSSCHMQWRDRSLPYDHGGTQDQKWDTPARYPTGRMRWRLQPKTKRRVSSTAKFLHHETLNFYHKILSREILTSMKQTNPNNQEHKGEQSKIIRERQFDEMVDSGAYYSGHASLGKGGSSTGSVPSRGEDDKAIRYDDDSIYDPLNGGEDENEEFDEFFKPLDTYDSLFKFD